VRTIYLKELADHFSSLRFLLMASLVFMASVVGVYLAGQGVRELLSRGAGPYLEGRAFLMLFTAPGAMLSLASLFALAGPLAPLVLGFDSVSRERSQGTLSKILSQPVYRDEVLLGKFLAGLAAMAVLLAALLLILSGLAMLGLGLVPSAGEAARLACWYLLSLLYLGLWLGLAILLSVACRSAPASAMACAALWVAAGFFVPALGQTAAGAAVVVADPSAPTQAERAAYDRVSRAVTMASPPAVFGEASRILLDPSHRGSRQDLSIATMSRLDRFLVSQFQGGVGLGQSLILLLPHLAVLAAAALVSFFLSFLVFARQEVRSA
jgi:ABC-2 type transport system permease protein